MKFHVPTKIHFGSGSISLLKGVIEEELKASRLLLVTDQGLVESGLAEKVISQLPEICVFDRVEPNPRNETVNNGGEWARRSRPDAVIGFGGGSSLDAAKAIALLATNSGKIEDYEGKGKYRYPPLPVVAIPTTCGTGSEVTWVSVVTHTERRFKMSIKGPEMFPEVALLDPDLLLTLPPFLIASTGMDALTHAVEAYTVKAANVITDIFAVTAVELILDAMERVYRDIKGDSDAREKIMLGSTLAGMAFGNSDVGAVHCLSEALGSLYDTPHGVANSLFLPHVMEYNLPAAEGRYADIARLAGIKGEEDGSLARKLIPKIAALSQSMGIPSLRDLGVKESDFLEIAEKSYQNNSNPSNPREMNVEDYLAILQKMVSEA
ncbi:MAG: iron-containing alcohol dehydrogenase [Candidatus Aminicenantes bacterium]